MSDDDVPPRIKTGPGDATETRVHHDPVHVPALRTSCRTLDACSHVPALCTAILQVHAGQDNKHDHREQQERRGKQKANQEDDDLVHKSIITECDLGHGLQRMATD